jgi:hypothetical protein
MKGLLIILTGVCSFLNGKAQTEFNRDAFPLHRAEKALTDVIIHDIFSPPVSSRIYLYANMAAYEVLVKSDPDHYASLRGQVRSFPLIPEANKKISASLAAVYAFMEVGRQLVFSGPALQDSLDNMLDWFKANNIDEPVYRASLEYGRQIADTILRWADKDHYKETRRLPRYRFLKKEGKWIPTPPAYMAAIEPYWNRIRLIALDSVTQYRPPLAIDFSKDTGSRFYKQAYDVYEAGNRLTADQKDIANFWDCNPFAVSMQGHLHFAIKKISPGGHWISIVTVVAQNRNMSMAEASSLYTITSIALFDAFISCWDEKYRSNVIRPETYINDYIDETWRPVLQTPPFPEYVSGHSIISAAAAVVLTRLLGEQVAFDDNTEVEFGLPVRHFSSFMQASEEAAISRFYGGIHYRAAIETGFEEGKKIGEWVYERIRLKK